MTVDLNEDAIVACADLIGRAGATSFDMAWTCPHVPGEEDDHNCPDVTWYAVAYFKGTRIQTDEHRTPSTAALAMAERLLSGATCRCLKTVALADGKPGCRWRLMGRRWLPGCDAAPIRVEGERGDVEAMRQAMAKRAGAR